MAVWRWHMRASVAHGFRAATTPTARVVAKLWASMVVAWPGAAAFKRVRGAGKNGDGGMAACSQGEHASRARVATALREHSCAVGEGGLHGWVQKGARGARWSSSGVLERAWGARKGTTL